MYGQSNEFPNQQLKCTSAKQKNHDALIFETKGMD